MPQPLSSSSFSNELADSRDRRHDHRVTQRVPAAKSRHPLHPRHRQTRSYGLPKLTANKDGEAGATRKKVPSLRIGKSSRSNPSGCSLPANLEPSRRLSVGLCTEERMPKRFHATEYDQHMIKGFADLRSLRAFSAST
jgi:hypothetical protein